MALLRYKDNEGNWINITSAQGIQGIRGIRGNGIVSTVRTAGTGLAGSTDTYTITYTSGATSTFTVMNGYAPQRGTDYWTSTDTAAMAADVDNSIQDALADYTPVSGSGAGDDTYACNIANKKAINFSFTIADVNAKEITFTNEPAGRCEVFLEITTSAAPGAITWTLNGGTVTWSTGSAPVLATGKTYRFMFFTSDSGTTWDVFASVGV